MPDKEVIAGLTRKEFIALPMEERHKRLAEQAKEFIAKNGYLPDDPCDGHSTMIEQKPVKAVMSVISEEQQDACKPTDEQLKAYLATPDDSVAAYIRKEFPDEFPKIGRAILWGQNIAKRQRDADLKVHLAEIAWLDNAWRDYSEAKEKEWAKILQTKLNRAREGLKALPNNPAEFWKGYWMGQIEVLDNAIAELEESCQAKK